MNEFPLHHEWALTLHECIPGNGQAKLMLQKRKQLEAAARPKCLQLYAMNLWSSCPWNGCFKRSATTHDDDETSQSATEWGQDGSYLKSVSNNMVINCDKWAEIWSLLPFVANLWPSKYIEIHTNYLHLESSQNLLDMKRFPTAKRFSFHSFRYPRLTGMPLVLHALY